MPSILPTPALHYRDTDIGALQGAIFAALVGADPFQIRSRTHAIRIADYVAIALWVVVALLFLYVRAGPDGRSPATERLRLSAALGVTALAGVLTVTTLILTSFNWSRDRDSVQLALTHAGHVALFDLCRFPQKAEPIGRIPTDELNDEFVTFDIEEAKQGGNPPSLCGTVRLRRAEITAIVETSSLQTTKSHP